MEKNRYPCHHLVCFRPHQKEFNAGFEIYFLALLFYFLHFLSVYKVSWLSICAWHDLLLFTYDLFSCDVKYLFFFYIVWHTQTFLYKHLVMNFIKFPYSALLFSSSYISVLGFHACQFLYNMICFLFTFDLFSYDIKYCFFSFT